MARTKGDDGLIADDIGPWALEKHKYLCRYIDISRATRKKYLPPQGQGGSAFFDLFCGTGRSWVRDTGQWVDGSAMAAWKTSVQGDAPFSEVYISDVDPEALSACEARLRAAGAPVIALNLNATLAAEEMARRVSGFGLYLAFIDPYSLELDFKIIELLSKLKRVDMMIHINQMDLQRNLLENIRQESSRIDRFAPGWRDQVNLLAPQRAINEDVIRYWRGCVANLGKWPSAEQKLITASKNQPLYWLLLAAQHDLAHRFWSDALDDGQDNLF